jgi:hypothetical protein
MKRPAKTEIWIRRPEGCLVCHSLKEAALFTAKETGCPISLWQITAALKTGYPFCGMRYSCEKPVFTGKKRPPILRRDQMKEGLIHMH